MHDKKQRQPTVAQGVTTTANTAQRCASLVLSSKGKTAHARTPGVARVYQIKKAAGQDQT